MVVEADLLIDVLHDVFYLPGYCLISAEHEDRRARAGDAAAESAGLFAAFFDRIESGDQHAADGFDDDVFEGAADQVIVVAHETCHQSGDVAPLADGVFEQDLLAEDLPGVGSPHFDLGMYDGDVQRRGCNGDDIEGEDGADEGDAAVDAGGDIVGMFDPGGDFFAEQGEADHIFFGEDVAEQVVGCDDCACCAGCTGAEATAGFYFFGDGDFEADGAIKFCQHFEQRGAGGVLCRVGGEGKSVFADDDDARLVEEADFHEVEGSRERHAKDIESAHEVGDGAGALDGDFVHDYELMMRKMSANTPEAVTSAPAPAPLTTSGCSL